MKAWIGKVIAGALQAYNNQGSQLGLVARDSIESEDGSGEFRFTVVKAVNGTILKVSKFVPNPRGPDWTHELHIVKDDERIADVFTRCLAVHALEK